MATKAYTGLERRKKTRWSVTFGDALVSRVIAIGGISTIASILLVVIVLLGTAFPLFRGASFDSWSLIPTQAYVHFGVDKNATLLWGMLADGTIEVRDTATGELLAEHRFDGAESKEITSSHLSIDQRHLVLGFQDGTCRTAQLEFETDLLAVSDVPDGVEVTEEDSLDLLDGAVYQWFDATGVRRIRFLPPEWSDPKVLGESPVLAVDYLPSDSANRLSSRTQSQLLAVVGDELVFADIKGRKNLLSGKIIESIELKKLKLAPRSESGKPLALMLWSGADQAVVVWPNGTLDRFSIADEIRFAESQSAVIGGGGLTCAAPSLARQTLLCGDDNGRLTGWMIVNFEDEVAGDEVGRYRLVPAHEIQVSESALAMVQSSQQSHVAVTCDSEGEVSLTYVTTGSRIESLEPPQGMRISDSWQAGPPAVTLDPAGDTLLLQGDGQLALVDFDIGYPEASWKAFFGKVWYEGHDFPKYIWQSSAGTEKSEIKLSLIPLVFGTLKATVYAMLISIPLSILAAVYTSEFMSSAARGRVKPVIELMASLPSVVLGYVAALVMAPYLQENLMAILIALGVVPITFIVAGHVWNLLPIDWAMRIQWLRLLGMVLCLPLSFSIAFGLAGPVQDQLFSGNLVQWISSDEGSPVGGWMLLFIPLAALIACGILFGPLSTWTRSIASRRSPLGYAAFALARLVLLTALVLILSWLAANVISNMGWDLRQGFFGSYQDRNALLVGGALGFCVIPIIYTISDDALQAVPQQLRSASLGCGATQWQTTTRIVVPSAMSGLFSAVMVGLGRAVGETMVVLMAAGNTPLMEWNPFNGFRTLSATLATELPEAAKGSTHFRTLFLAALLLFLLTLVANTVAEFVRIRFRKRASQL